MSKFHNESPGLCAMSGCAECEAAVNAAEPASGVFTTIPRRERCMCHCAPCIREACDQCAEGGAWCADLEPDWGKPSLAVIASDGKGNGCVMHFVGIHIEQWRSDVGSTLKDLGLDDAPCGISVWDGKTKSVRGYDGDYDAWLEGDFREPTPEEWDCINHDDCPWNEREWFLPAPAVTDAKEA